MSAVHPSQHSGRESEGRPSTATTVVGRCRWMWARLRAFAATQVELHERMLLLEQPWKEDLLHWSHDGETWRVHGHLAPPTDGRRHSVTREGWCPGRRCPRGPARTPDRQG